ncbi:hypothetical protein ACHAXM_009954 [Skeletonema potamos]
MTVERMQNEVLLQTSDSSFAINFIPKGIIEKQAKGLLHNAQRKMLFHQRYVHSTHGPAHDALFFATLHTIVDKSCFDGIPGFPYYMANNNISTSPDGTTVEFVNTGAARLKKQAETLAAADLVVQWAELNIDIRDPPDLAGMKKTQEEELFKADIQRSQMILEVLDVSAPKFDTNEHHPDGWVSMMKFYCRGVPIDTKPVFGRSKAEAEGRALVAATESDSPLEYFIGQKKMNDIKTFVEESPAGHVAALHVPELPEEVLDRLMNAIGSHSDHMERMEEHVRTKKRYEQDFNERRLRKQQQKDRRMKIRRNEVSTSTVGLSENDTFLKEEQSRAEKAASDPHGRQGQMKSVRDALPIKAIQDDLIHALKSQQVVVVSGGTGSGKSTQCPQYILEDAIANGMGDTTRIIMTQPRKIAAISVAERVAAERDEEIGQSVGYTVRFNKQSPREAASVEFVTTGVLLRRLVNDSFLEGVSHVMIDEVHERDINTDFLLILLRDLLKKRTDLRVILMSATLDAESFGKYFSSRDDVDVSVLSVPTKPRHPVEVLHLDEMENLPKHIQELSQSLLRLHDQQLYLDLEVALAEEKAAMKLAARAVAEDEGENMNESSSSSDSDDSDSDDDEDGVGFESHSSYSPRLMALNDAVFMRGGKIGRLTSNKQHKFIDKRETEEITTRLLANLAQHVAQEETSAGRKGSILCFLPGLDEIKEATGILQKESDSELKACMNIIPLHSTIPQNEQQKVFFPADEGTVKVILATNIAESSVTIDDVLVVIDGGLCREMNYSAERSMSEMVTVPISKASATQRLGRAGRVAPGWCYRLYSKGQHHAMLERPQPEIQRTALEATCLNTINMTVKGVETFLSRAMDPPSSGDVAHAMERLRKLGAVTSDGSNEALTPLGSCLARLPLDPAVAKMLIMGSVLQCLDPVLTAAACSSSRDIFYAPLGMRKEQHNVKKTFSETSDTMASVEAYDEFQYILKEHGWEEARAWASANFVSIHTLTSVTSVRWQLISELQALGLVSHSDLVTSRGKTKEFRHDALVNRNAGIDSLITAVWATGVPDNLGARRQLGNFGTLRTKTENHAGLHPSSVTFHRKPPRDRKTILPVWFFYREMVLSSQVFLRGCTALEPEQVMLFGGYRLETSAEFNGRKRRVLDDWIMVEGRCSDTLDALSIARKEIDVALDMKVKNPRSPLPASQQTIIDAVCDCFSVLDDDSESEYH